MNPAHTSEAAQEGCESRFAQGTASVSETALRNNVDEIAREGEPTPVRAGMPGPHATIRARVEALCQQRGWRIWPDIAPKPNHISVCIDDRPDFLRDDSEWQGWVGCEIVLEHPPTVEVEIETHTREQCALAVSLWPQLLEMQAALSQIVTRHRVTRTHVLNVNGRREIRNQARVVIEAHRRGDLTEGEAADLLLCSLLDVRRMADEIGAAS